MIKIFIILYSLNVFGFDIDPIQPNDVRDSSPQTPNTSPSNLAEDIPSQELSINNQQRCYSTKNYKAFNSVKFTCESGYWMKIVSGQRKCVQYLCEEVR